MNLLPGTRSINIYWIRTKVKPINVKIPANAGIFYDAFAKECVNRKKCRKVPS
jgi:hypothetical protein